MATRKRKVEIEISAQDKATKIFRSVGKSVSTITSEVFSLQTALVGLAGLGSLAYGVQKLTTSASNLAETVSKSNAIFKDQSKNIMDWSENSATAFGMSQQAALDAASSIGNMFDQLGAGTNQAAKSSKQMVQLAADIASFHNVSGGAAQVLDTMQSAFRGEYDALQRYIPTINAAAVQHEALAMTGKATTKELTDLEKALAAQKIIMNDAGAAVGDYARTSEGLANQQRELAAHFDDLKSGIGNSLLPVVTQMVGETNNWIEANKDLIANDVAGWVESIGKGMGAVLPLAKDLAHYIGTINNITERTNSDKLVEIADDLARANKELATWQEKLKKTEGMTLYKDEAVATAKNNIQALEIDIARLQKAQDALLFKPIKPPITSSGGVPTGVPTGVPGPTSHTETEVEAITLKSINSAKKFADSFVNDVRGATDKAWAEWEEYHLEYQAWVADEIEFTNEEWSKFVSGQKETTSELSAFMTDAFSGWATQYSSTLTDMVWGADSSFKSIAESFGKMITQMLIQWQMTKAMTWAFGAEGEGGAVTSFLSGIFHGGGVVGQSGSHRMVPASTFIGAPRMHGGGLAGDEVPSILKRGEIVLTPKQFKSVAGNSPNVQINVIDQTSEKKTVDQRQSKWDGEKWVMDIILSAVDTNRGNFGRGMKAALGRM